ncbi:MerR family transcriptional regulator [Mesorhizobium sp. B2-4-12]|nr:MerR family transcriptional regulator [Mesorhizobium sp. B2-4-12]
MFTEIRVPSEKTYSTDGAAKELGISKSTLLRWFREKRIEDVKRDRNGWRVFTPADVKRIRKVL